ncbi:conserved hypothetical protein, secreted [Candidatus Magnetobacterium bavaricum]|uniref:Fibronectin type-III domain-containing protein n=1 Tax=Candidatus Magnetobacterium bavaricum TaxID=29290 RepID=A0A0F3H3M6_9BACT|nr:conserved hypothetical protein, secreted [Candidatus Magnetobacterium bavaricum]
MSTNKTIKANFMNASGISAPGSITAAKGTNNCYVTWSSVSSASKYIIYWGNSSSVNDIDNCAGILTTNSTAYDHTGIVSGSDYYYRVKTCDSNGCGALSSAVKCTTAIDCSSKTITPTSKTFTSSGGSGSVSVTANTGCIWTASSSDGWLTITSGSSGSGNGTVNYAVAANTGTSLRTATMTVADKTFMVTQEGKATTPTTYKLDVKPNYYGLGNIRSDAQCFINSDPSGIHCDIVKKSSDSNSTSICSSTFESGQTVRLGQDKQCALDRLSVWFNDCDFDATEAPVSPGPGCRVKMDRDRSVSIVVSLPPTGHLVDKATKAGNTLVRFFGYVGSMFDGGLSAASSSNDGMLVMWQMNGTDISNVVPHGVVGTEWQILGYGDFDSDGTDDILWQNTNTGEVHIWSMKGVSIASHSSPAKTLGSDWQFAGIGDLDGDGRSDVLWRNTDTGMVVIWLMNSTAISNVVSPATLGSEWQIAGVGDFDGDGKSDVLWRNTDTGMVYIWLMNGAAISSHGSPATLGSEWQFAGIGDFDGDGRSDVMWRNASTGMVVIWLMNGMAISNGGSPATLGYEWQIISIGDFNSDGKSDIMLRNISTSMVYIWLMNGTAISSGGSPAKALDFGWQIQ